MTLALILPYSSCPAHFGTRGAGFKDAPTYFRQHLAGLSPATLVKYRAVVKAFSEQVAVRFGVTVPAILAAHPRQAVRQHSAL
jgi:hypothetical protein